MKIIQIGFLPFTLVDLIDILAVTVIFYQVYRIMRGTRATQMFMGLLLILFTGSIAQMFGLSGMTWLIHSIGAVWVLAFVILFQSELRQMLLRIGHLRFLRTLFKASGEKVVSEMTQAILELSKRRFGGLFVIQRTTGLRGVVETGVSLGAEVSADLLVSIFYPRSPLHDGAVLISGETILAARCILPLSLNPDLDSTYGTRHRAGIGITEETDAIAVVISEETGNISIASYGKFVATASDGTQLKEHLKKLLYPGSTVKGSKSTIEEEPVPEQSDGVST